MLSLRNVIIVGVAAMLAGCGASPEKSIEKDCVRLKLFSDINESADPKTACACLAGKVKEGMSETDLKSLASMLKEAKTTDDFDQLSTKHNLGDMAGMTFLGAAKSCAF